MAMQEREKNMGLSVLLLCLMVLYAGQKSQTSKKIQRMEDEFLAAQDRLNKAKDMLKATEPVAEKKEGETEVKKFVYVEPERRPTLSILRDLTAKGEADGLKIISTESTGNGIYRLTIQSNFNNVVRYISFLERTEGSFAVTGAGFQKVEGNVDGATTRELQAVVSLRMKTSG